MPHPPGKPRSPAHRRSFGRLRAQSVAGSYALLFAPALAAGAIGLRHLGDPIVAAELAAIMCALALAGSSTSLPLHLMPVTRTVLRVGTPVVAAALVVPIAAYGGHPVVLEALVQPLLAAWIVTALGAWFAARFESTSCARVAVIGDATLARALAGELRRAGISGYRVLGVVEVPAPGRPPGESAAGAMRVLGELGELREIVDRHAIDLIVFAQPPHGGGVSVAAIDEAAQRCLDLPVRFEDANQLYEELLGHVPAGTINAGWFRYLMHPRYHPHAGLRKRAMDVIGGLVGLGLALPVIVIAALAIKLGDPGPVLYRQRRIGEGGGTFDLIKLRTMRSQGSAVPARWSGRDDERVTRVGRWLRTLHIDELPQLWSVVVGTMTLVGPRPEQPEMVAELERLIPFYERRHLAKPGLTGWAQVRCGYAGSEVGSAWKLCHDLYYLKHRSVLSDLLVLLETPAAIGLGSQYERPAPDRRFLIGSASEGSWAPG